MSMRPAAVAGRFYPADAAALRADVRACFESVRGDVVAASDTAQPARAPKAIIAPHAGYAYSGPIAASAYSALTAAPSPVPIERVVLLGPCHRVPLRGLALAAADRFDTPLGPVPVDAAAADLLQFDFVASSEAAHALEHCLEVQLPFLAEALASPFTIVPLVVGDATDGEVSEVLQAVWGGPETLIVISSDLSHFHDYEQACRLDAEASQAIEAMSPERLRPEQACGHTAIRGLLAEARRRGMETRVLDVRNSGDTAGSRQEVVGYGAYALYERA